MNKAHKKAYECSPDELVWSEYTGICRMCGRRFRISEQFIAEQRQHFEGVDGSDEDYAGAAEWCLGCAIGEEVEGEIVESIRDMIHGLVPQEFIDFFLDDDEIPDGSAQNYLNWRADSVVGRDSRRLIEHVATELASEMTTYAGKWELWRQTAQKVAIYAYG